jgi:hypothetical protein
MAKVELDPAEVDEVVHDVFGRFKKKVAPNIIDICILYVLGGSYHEISKKHGVGVADVTKIVHTLRETFRLKRVMVLSVNHPRELWNAIEKTYESGGKTPVRAESSEHSSSQPKTIPKTFINPGLSETFKHNADCLTRALNIRNEDEATKYLKLMLIESPTDTTKYLHKCYTNEEYSADDLLESMAEYLISLIKR